MPASITNSLTEFLDTPTIRETENPFVNITDREDEIYDSVFAKACELKLTFAEYIVKYPDEALFIAERAVAAWNDVLKEAILRNKVHSIYGEVRVTKNTTDLIKIRLQQANEELMAVRKLRETVTSGTRKERLVNALYNRGVEGGDTRALLYMIDRLDGKIGDNSANVSVDFINKANIAAIINSLFKDQLKVLNAGVGPKIACCSRRAGKSHLAVSTAFISCLNKPNTKCLYIGKTAKLAESLFNTAAKKLVDTLKLVDSKGKPLNYKKFENGSSVMIRGLSNTKDPDSIRGHTFEVIIIDEFFHLNSDLINYLTTEVLEPSQMDYSSSYQMLMIGTPPKERGTYGQKVWEEYEIPKFKWTWADNPYIKDGEAYLVKKAKEKGVPLDSVFMLREYRGQWVFESDMLLYPDYYTYDPGEVLPAFNVDSVSIGVDYGTGDNTAIIGVAWDNSLNRGYVFFEKKFNMLSCPHGMGMLPYLKAMAKQCWRIALDFWPHDNKQTANKRIMWSADSTDQVLTQELSRDVVIDGIKDMKMQIIDAHRGDQQMMRDKIKDLLRTGAMLLPKNSAVALECELTSYVMDANGNPTKDLDNKKFHPDLLPALRYAMWRLVGYKNIGTDINLELVQHENVTYGGSFDIDFEVAPEPIFTMKKVG